MFPPSLSSTTRQPGSTRQSCPTTTTCTAPGSVSLQDNQGEEEEKEEEEEEQEQEEEQDETLIKARAGSSKEITFDRMACKFSEDNSVTQGNQRPGNW